jgi:hypothetical protein
VIPVPPTSAPAPTADEAQRWGARVPRRALTLGAPLLVGAAVVVSFVQGQTPDVATVTSAWWAVGSTAQGVVIASVGLLVARPHRSIGWAALASTVLAAGAAGPAGRQAWVVAAVLLTLLALADVVGAARQRVLAREWTGTAPGVPDGLRTALLARRPLATVAAGAGLVVTACGVALYVHDARAVEVFRAASHTETGVVVSVDEIDLTATVRVGGEPVAVPFGNVTPRVGDEVAVTVTSGSDRAELAADPFDATGALFLAGMGAVVTLVLLRDESERRRDGRRLLDGGAASVTLLAVPTGGDWLDLAPVGSSGAPLTRVRVREWTDSWRTEGDAPALDDQYEDDEDDEDDEADGTGASWYETQMAAEAARVAAMSDEELLRLGAEQHAARLAAEDHVWTVLDSPAVVVVHGLTAQGDHVVVEATDTARWFVSTLPARDVRLRLLSWRWRWWGGRDHGRAAAPRQLEVVATPSPGGAAGAVSDPWRQVGWAAVHGTGRWMPWLLLPAVAWLAGGLADVLSVGALISTAPALGLGYAWATAAQHRVRLTRAGVRVRGAVVGWSAPWPKVAAAVADGDTLVIRLVDPADAVILSADPRLGPFVPGASTPLQAAEAINRRRDREATGPHVRRPAFLPTPGATVLLAWLVAAVVGVVR